MKCRRCDKEVSDGGNYCPDHDITVVARKFLESINANGVIEQILVDEITITGDGIEGTSEVLEENG